MTVRQKGYPEGCAIPAGRKLGGNWQGPEAGGWPRELNMARVVKHAFQGGTKTSGPFSRVEGFADGRRDADPAPRGLSTNGPAISSEGVITMSVVPIGRKSANFQRDLRRGYDSFTSNLTRDARGSIVCKAALKGATA